ncbi:Pectin lyase fold/virulence factor [Arabidopsis thaliana x Arabidopsis arenosa]|uniref:Pectin lyase fold/virulence factor n=1 Tax=Arabidopsis thaliana x Arabidopsis arenosa TaxID=1240361 RepID=A0A8T2BM67_9BRAS|nr:Pectin lyase fold/virulence factor [Arabidopsis thaliana x Arabidopsis arenosa]
MVSIISGFKLILFIAAVASIISAATSATLAGRKVFDVRSYGARGDGKTDNAIAFTKAWKEACQWKGYPRVYIPFGTFYIGAVTFTGPCKSRISFIIKGTLLAPKDPNAIKQDTWIIFRYVDYLTVSGGGILDGQGSYSWPLNNCRKTLYCRALPMNMGFQFVRFSRLSRIKSINSKMGHFNFFAVQYFDITRVRIMAPGDSPNTDGIKIGSSNHMKIHHVDIGTGDDCIAILSGTTNLDIYNVKCGPGHGISVGSLGKFKGEKSVQGLTVRDSIFNGTSNGVRIKTWASPGSPNLVSNFLYKNLQMINVENPINIDQRYCPNPPCSLKSFSQIQIKDVKFNNIWGTSTNKVAVKLQCSKNVPCKNVELFNVNLVHRGRDGPAISLCENVGGWTRGKISPPSCIR